MNIDIGIKRCRWFHCKYTHTEYYDNAFWFAYFCIYWKYFCFLEKINKSKQNDSERYFTLPICHVTTKYMHNTELVGFLCNMHPKRLKFWQLINITSSSCTLLTVVLIYIVHNFGFYFSKNYQIKASLNFFFAWQNFFSCFISHLDSCADVTTSMIRI